MSFGISIGDFLAIAQLANKVRKDFVGAPEQFNSISKELRALSIVVQDVDTQLEGYDLSTQQELSLEEISDNCRQLLAELEATVQQYSEIEPSSGNLKRSIRRAWKRLKWEPENVRELRDQITSNTVLLNTFLGGISSQANIATKQGVERLQQRQDNEERQKILDWLTPIDYIAQQHHDFHTKRQVGTGQWFLNSEEYQLWVKTEGRTLFCPGIPGAGKTILTSIIIDNLLKTYDNEEGIGVICFYCNFRRQPEQNLIGLVSSLLKQLGQQLSELPEVINQLYRDHIQKGTRPEVDDLLGIVDSVLAKHSRVFVVVDALDECQQFERGRFLSNVFDLQQKRGLNILVTSRYIQEITNKFSGCAQLEIRASHEDIETYLKHRVSSLSGLVSQNITLQDEIKNGIIEVVHGMFLLAQLHLESLRGKTSVKAVRVALKKLAAGADAYTGAYNEAMGRIECQLPDQQELAKQVLFWVIHARRRLRIAELRIALGVEFGETRLDEDNLPENEDMLSVCAGLVTTDNESKVILVHYTTEEYFKQTKDKWFPKATSHITRVCITYISFDVFENCSNSIWDRLRDHQFYDYATRYWASHALECSYVGDEMINFLRCQKKVAAACQALGRYYSKLPVVQGDILYSGALGRGLTGLHLAAYLGVEKALERLIDGNMRVDSREGRDRTPLSYATESGHLAVVRILLDRGADVNSVDRQGWKPLLYSVRNGNLDVLQLLLDRGAEADSGGTSCTPLSYAAEHGKADIVRLLLRKGATVNTRKIGKRGCTPIFFAVKEGHGDVVELLLEAGASITDDGLSLISYAILYRRTALVELLADRGIRLDIANQKERRLLIVASSFGDTFVKLVEVLLEKAGADLTVVDDDGWTPLLSAVWYGHYEIVELLLIKGSEPNAATHRGQSPLWTASYQGHPRVARLLLKFGADVAASPNDGRTPLIAATQRGHSEMVDLLLDWGAEADQTDHYGRTALSYAASAGYLSIAQLLCPLQSDLNSGDHFQRSAVFYASMRGHLRIIEMLFVDKSVDVDKKDCFDSTPLSVAARYGDIRTVGLLLSTGRVTVDAQNCLGQSPLWFSRRYNYLDMEKLLLDHLVKGGLSVRDSDMSVKVGWRLHEVGPRWCLVCTLGIASGEVSHYCQICYGGINVCAECYERGGRCSESSHEMSILDE